MKISMKKLILLAALGLGVPAVAGAGYYAPGFVVTGSGYMYGSYNVRFNTASPAYAYIGAYSTANSTVGFYAYDGTTYFSCYVPTTSTLYSAATAIKNGSGAGNGTELYVTKDASTSECTYIYSNQVSYYAH